MARINVQDSIVELRRGAQHVRQLYLYVQDAENRLSVLINETCDRIARSDIERIGATVALRSLRTIPDGVRLSALEARGITTIGQLAALTRQDLLRIHGIGDFSAIALEHVVSRFAAENRSMVRILPDPTNRRSEDSDLLRLLHALQRFRSEVKPDLAAFYSRAHELSGKANTALNDPLVLGTTTARRDYRLWIEKWGSLAGEVQSFASEWQRRLQVLDSASFREEHVWKEYRSNNAGAVAALESVRPGASAIPKPRPPVPAPPVSAPRPPTLGAVTPLPPPPPIQQPQVSQPLVSPWAPPDPTGPIAIPTESFAQQAALAIATQRAIALRDELRRRNAEHRAVLADAKRRNRELDALLKAKQDELQQASLAASIENEGKLAARMEARLAELQALIDERKLPLPPEVVRPEISVPEPVTRGEEPAPTGDEAEVEDDAWSEWRRRLFDKDADPGAWREGLADARQKAAASSAMRLQRLREAQGRYLRAVERQKTLEAQAPLAPVLFPARDVSVFGQVPAEVAEKIEAFALNRGPLTATLRRYQEFGAKFICHQRRTLLGDEMGLGKTVEVLAAMCHLHARGENHFVVVAPNSVLYNWERETKQHTRMQPYVAHGPARMSALRNWKINGGVLITTYGTFGLLEPSVVHCDLLAVDECHLVKNPRAMRSRSVSNLGRRAKHVVLMSGTALENRLTDLGNLLALAQPELTELVDYFERSVRPDPEATRDRIASVYLRRVQADVLSELPPRVNLTELVEPTVRDREAYQLSSTDIMTIRKSASLGDGTLESAKFRRLRELLAEYESDGRKVVVFSYFLSVLDNVVALTGSPYFIAGSVSAGSRQATIDRFNAEDGFAVMVCQIESGGLGMNLQSAQVVVLMEPQLKPSTELQAIARVHRLGQTSTVTVHRIVARDTVENRLVELVKYKQAIFDDYADPSSLRDQSSMAMDPSLSLEDDLRRALSA